MKKTFYKRQVVFIILLALIPFFCCACDNLKGEELKNETKNKLVVEYIDVGQGDCSLINLPDGKTMIIDTGGKEESIYKIVSQRIRLYTDTIDYLVLTHPDIAHISNAHKILQEYKVKKAFIPRINKKELYPTFNEIYNLLIEKGVEVNISKSFLDLSTEDYTLTFLTPSENSAYSSYLDFNSSLLPTASMENNISPIIYLEYSGIRFLFTGDAESSQEKVVMDYYNSNLYNVLYKTKRVNLEKIDFYKLGGHGSQNSNSEEFISLIKPKNVVISVGGINNENCPSSKVLSHLSFVNPDYFLYRTDRDRTIKVIVNENGEYQVEKDIKGNT